MENTSKTTQPPVLPTSPVLLAPVPPQTDAIPPLEGLQMQDVAAEEEQPSPAQVESSDSSASKEWNEPEDPHPPEKRVRRSSPDYDPAEDRPKTYQHRRKKTRRMMEETPESAATHSEEHEAQTTTDPSESEPEPQQKKGHKNKMPTKVRVVEEINPAGVPVKPDKIQGPATHACGCLAREAVRIIHDDWRKVPKEDKDYIW